MRGWENEDEDEEMWEDTDVEGDVCYTDMELEWLQW